MFLCDKERVRGGRTEINGVEEKTSENAFSRDEARDFEAFRYNNRHRVNRVLNSILWACILTGPAIALGIASGVFTKTTYTACLVISIVMTVVAGSNWLILKKKPSSFVSGVLALITVDVLLCYMNVSHIDLRLTWFLVPLLSLLFCDAKVYIGASLVNYVAMGVSIWLSASYYADLRLDFASPMVGFVNTFAGCTIEAILMFVAGYALGRMSGKYYRRMIRQHAEAQDQQARLQEQMSVLESMAEIYDYVNHIDFVESTEMSLREETLHKIVIEKGQDHTHMTQGLRSQIAADMVDAFWEFTDITTVPTRLIGRQSIAGEFVNNETGWFRAQYIRIKGRLDQKPDVVIYTIQTIDADKRKEEYLIRVSTTDWLTRLFNRRSYEEDVAALNAAGIESDIALISIDVNGLKNVNDSLGHRAGDELIQGAATCLLSAIGSRGKAYRVGGDEFIALVHVDDRQVLIDEIREKAAAWKGTFVDSLSISIGSACHAEYPDASIEELEKLADKSMYEEKEKHYEQLGLSPRHHYSTE